VVLAQRDVFAGESVVGEFGGREEFDQIFGWEVCRAGQAGNKLVASGLFMAAAVGD
jgi:hypothetical protein